MPSWLFLNLIKMNVAVLLSVYNRKDSTLNCLSLCYRQIEMFKASGKYKFDIYLTEDGCTDGTVEAVAVQFPEVNIIHGDGNLFWNRGMCAAWNEAAAHNYDFYMWLNDDTMLHHGAFVTMLENSASLGHRAIVVGTACDSSGKLSYGGRTRSGKIIRPDDIIPVACDIFNGNLVLIPNYVYQRLGTMDPKYSHSFGDYDYGIRAMKKGITEVIAPGILASCNRNPGVPKWRDPSLSLKERYSVLLSPKGRPFKEQFLYDRRCCGILMAVLHFFSLNLKVLFPKAFIK